MDALKTSLTRERAIAYCFDIYEREISLRMEQDMQFGKAELGNLVEQKQAVEIVRPVEIARLQQLLR